MATDFKLPVLGEGIASGTITKIMVAVGDDVAVEQPVLELETDKAVLEVPSGVSGKVLNIAVTEGATISVGQVVFSVEAAGAAESAPAPEEKAAKPAPEPEPEPSPAPKPAPAPTPEPIAEEEEAHESEEDVAPTPRPAAATRAEPARRESRHTMASPSVRRLARDIGVDVNMVPTSDPRGRIAAEDVKHFARQTNLDSGPSVRSMGISQTEPLPNFARWGDVQYHAMSTIRRRTAERMTLAWQSIPHVTQQDKADITDLERLRKQYSQNGEAAGTKLTVTAFLIKILASALKKFPQFNSSLDLENNEIIFKHYYNVGVAVDTERGLLVPVIRDVDKKNIIEISLELNEMAQRARNRKTKLEDMQGGTFTLTNLGGIGGTGFTPIINMPEVAILGVSRSRVEPMYEDGEFVPRTFMPLSLSYDHRVIDGADAARFTRWVAEAIEQPFLLMLEGSQ